MIFFDGEEGAISMGAGDPNFKPIGSAHFAERLADFYPNAKPEKMLDFDMVCDRDLHLKIGAVLDHVRAARGEEVLGDRHDDRAAALSRSRGRPIRSRTTTPHLQPAGIPSFVVIDFEYEPFYNTTAGHAGQMLDAEPGSGRAHAAAISVFAVSAPPSPSAALRGCAAVARKKSADRGHPQTRIANDLLTGSLRAADLPLSRASLSVPRALRSIASNAALIARTYGSL